MSYLHLDLKITVINEELVWKSLSWFLLKILYLFVPSTDIFS